MQRIRDMRAEFTARETLAWIAAARSNFGYWEPDDFEQFARESAARAAAALETIDREHSTRRRN